MKKEATKAEEELKFHFIEIPSSRGSFAFSCHQLFARSIQKICRPSKFEE